MTLLIGTVARAAKASKSHTVITADGRCNGFDGVKRTSQSNVYQKIFPIASSSVVIAHHGENVICGKPVKEFLSEFMRRNPSNVSASIKQVSDSLKEYSDQQTQETLKRILPSKILGFWIAGFGKGHIHPELHEICWEKEEDSGQIVFEEYIHGNLTFGGDAQHYVNQYCTQAVDGMFSWDRLPDQSVDYAVKFHSKLYGIAEPAQLKNQTELFGGHRHQVVITQEGWRWTTPPLDEQR
jgi:hypothetical protein